MAKRKHGPPYSPDEWFEEIPFDVAEWGNKDVSWYNGGKPVFESEEEFEQARRDAAKLPKYPPDPAV